jgi:hypothetical protein
MAYFPNSTDPTALLVAFAKLPKATINFTVFVYPSVLKEQLGSHWTSCNEILYLSVFRKSIEKIPVSLKSDRNNG